MRHRVLVVGLAVVTGLGAGGLLAYGLCRPNQDAVITEDDAVAAVERIERSQMQAQVDSEAGQALSLATSP